MDFRQNERSAMRLMELTRKLLETTPVWRIAGSDSSGEPLVTPIKIIPVKNTKNKLFGSMVIFANGTKKIALIGNLDPENSKLNEHFITLSIENDDKWVYLARYHDVGFTEHGPEALSAILNLPVSAIFPISYDLRKLIVGNSDALCGTIEAVPRERLSRREIMALVFSSEAVKN